jgi:hypothetical protein
MLLNDSLQFNFYFRYCKGQSLVDVAYSCDTLRISKCTSAMGLSVPFLTEEMASVDTVGADYGHISSPLLCGLNFML